MIELYIENYEMTEKLKKTHLNGDMCHFHEFEDSVL